MADCCAVPAGGGWQQRAAGGCQGPPVAMPTVKALLNEAALARFEPGDYRLCLHPGCDVVYFNGTETNFRIADLRAEVWQKAAPGRRTFCYCFGETDAGIADEIARTGGSRAVVRVRAHIAAGRCACEIRNPRGVCCLGDLAAAVDRAMSAPPGGRIVSRRKLRIGELSAASGLTRDALRYYERQGLLSRPRRTSGGFREYDPAAVDRLRFIKQAQAHGLSIKEIRELLAYQEQGGRRRCRSVQDLLARKLVELDERRRELDLFRTALRGYLEMCERTLSGQSDGECPVVADLVKP